MSTFLKVKYKQTIDLQIYYFNFCAGYIYLLIHEHMLACQMIVVCFARDGVLIADTFSLLELDFNTIKQATLNIHSTISVHFF